jgi:hypothetical protein
MLLGPFRFLIHWNTSLGSKVLSIEVIILGRRGDGVFLGMCLDYPLQPFLFVFELA